MKKQKQLLIRELISSSSFLHPSNFVLRRCTESKQSWHEIFFTSIFKLTKYIFSSLYNSPAAIIKYIIKTQSSIFQVWKFFFLSKQWKQKMISCKRPGTRYGKLLNHCGYLGYKKESRKRLSFSITPHASNILFLLPLFNGQDLSRTLKR